MTTILDTPITDTKLPTTWVPSAGSDRLGVVFTHYEANSATFPDDLADTISWRGQALTRIARQTAFDGGTGSCVDVWVLNEAGIAAGEVVGTGNFTSTIPAGGGISNSGTWGSTVLTLQDANQSADLTTRIATATAATPATPMPHEIGINTFANDFVLFGATTSVPDTLTWVNATEDTDAAVYSAFQTSVAHATPVADGLLTASIEAAAGNSYGTCLIAVSIPPATVAPPKTITGAESNSTADVAHAGSTLTITVDDSDGVGSATINDVAMTNVTIVDATTVTATVPVDINLAAGSSANVIVNNGSNSNAYAVTFAELVGFTGVALTVDYAQLAAESPFNLAEFSEILTGDICVFESVVDGYAVSMSGDGVFILLGAPAGTYNIDYYIRDASDNFNASAEIGTIIVDAGVGNPDTDAPVINLIGGNQTITQGSPWVEPGYSATDNIDGDITGDVVVAGDTVDENAIADYTLTYDVSDAAGNPATQRTRVITVVAADTVIPVILLTGGNQTITQGSPWVEPGYSATDNIDGNITGDVVVAGDTVDENAIADYTLTYDVSDAAGNPATQRTRIITVVAVVEVPTGGSSVVSIHNGNLAQGPTKDIEKKAVFVGVCATNVNQTLYLNSQSDLDEALGESDSELKTQVIAAQQNGGDSWEAYARPVAPSDDWRDEINIVMQTVSPEIIVICTPITDSNDINEAQIKALSITSSLSRRVSTCLAAPGIDSGNQTWSEYVSMLAAIITGVAAYRCAVVPQLHGDNLGVLVGRLCRNDVSVADSPMRVSTGPLLQNWTTPIDRNGVPLTSAVLSALDDLRFSVPRNYTDFDGIYWSDCNLLDAEGGDYQVIENLRVVDKAARKIRIILINMIADRGVNDTQISKSLVKNRLMRPLREMSKSTVFAGKQFVGEIKAPDNNSIIIDFPTKNNLVVYLKVRPYNSPKKIDTFIALDLS